jgi:sugar lactone lactonase YvrE
VNEDISFRAITAARGTLCEGPSWLPELGAFQWVDIIEGRLCRWFEEGEMLQERRFEPPLSCALPLRESVVLASESDLWLYDWEADSRRHLASLPIRTGTRLNDGGIAPDGAIWVGSTSEEGSLDSGKLFRVTLEGQFDVVLPRVGISNGIGWLPDGRTVYVDSPTRTVETLSMNATGTCERQTFAIIDGPGIPDGLVVDLLGTVWVALWDGSAVTRLARDGTTIGTYPIPVPRCTSVAIGGAHGDLVLVTTASWGLSEAQVAAAPLSGHVLVGRMGG